MYLVVCFVAAAVVCLFVLDVGDGHSAFVTLKSLYGSGHRSQLIVFAFKSVFAGPTWRKPKQLNK